MIKLSLVIAALLATTPIYAKESASVNGITSNDVANMTNAPVINSVGQNTTVQVNQNDHEQVEDLKCPLPTLSATAGYNVQQADNNYNNYRTEGQGVNAIIGFSMPVGAEVKCGDLFKAKMVIVQNNILDAKVGQCLKWDKMGYTLNRDKLLQNNLITKEQNKSLMFCEYVSKVEERNPEQFKQDIKYLTQENNQLKNELDSNKVTSPKLKGYREYRIRFKDWVAGCNTGCNGGYKFIKEYITYIKSGSSGGVNIYAEPYNDGKVSVYVRGGWNTWKDADIERQRYVMAGLPAKIVGVRGSEIYE